jgi:hypothetical protein
MIQFTCADFVHSGCVVFVQVLTVKMREREAGAEKKRWFVHQLPLLLLRIVSVHVTNHWTTAHVCCTKGAFFGKHNMIDDLYLHPLQ